MNTIHFNENNITPSKVVCVGRNYVDHIRELGNELPSEPVIFVKPNSSICTDIQTHTTDEIHYEGELSFLVVQGKIIGVGFGLDLTKRQIQAVLKEKKLPWERAKAFDNSAVFSHFIPFSSDVADLKMELFINDSLKQASGCEFMINSPVALLEEISSFMTLQDYDIVMSGTPGGAGKINHGDRFDCKIYNGDSLILEHSWIAR